jgi:hypothetical protein
MLLSSKKKIASFIISNAKKKEEGESSPSSSSEEMKKKPESDYSPGLDAGMEGLISAIHAKDSKKALGHFKNMFSLIDMEEDAQEEKDEEGKELSKQYGEDEMAPKGNVHGPGTLPRYTKE